MKDMRDYPFINWLYSYMEDKNFFKDCGTADKLEKEIYEIAGKGKNDFDTMLEIEWRLSAIEREYHSFGFLWGYLTAVNVMKGITVMDKAEFEKMRICREQRGKSEFRGVRS